MVKYTLAWSVIAASSLGAVYGMSHAAIEAENTIYTSSETALVTPPSKHIRIESGLNYFRFREGYLEWETQRIASSNSKDSSPIKCFGRTQYYDVKKRGIIEEINDYFSGRLTMSGEDEEGISSGSVRALLRAEEVRYTLKCGFFEKMIVVSPRDWPSNVYAKKLAMPNSKTAAKNAMRSESDVTIIATKGKSTTMRLVPGSKNAVVASFSFEAKKKMRITGIEFTSQKWFVQPGVLKFVHLTMDGKDPDSSNIISKAKSLYFGGLGDYGLFETVLPGKHTIEVRASIMNAPSKLLFSDSFTLTNIKGIAGNGLKVKLGKPIKLQTYSVPFDKKRTRQDDENLEK